MKKPTEILSDEHKNILKVIEALSLECRIIESGKKLDEKFFMETIDFIRNYADKFHHAKEEDILFKELCKDTVQMRCNPVEQMIHEHDLGRNFVTNMIKGLEENDKLKVIQNAKGYVELLREHIYKEDNILYPMADESLSQNVQKLMYNKFQKIEKENKTKRKYLDFAENVGKYKK